MGRGLEEGDSIPDFELPDDRGNLISSNELIQDGPAVIFFYPRDETKGCTVEACAFRDHYSAFADTCVRIVGISSDTIESHKKFRSKFNLPFPLLSDRGGKVRRKFGVPGALFGLIPGRTTYVVDQDGIIRHVFDSMMQFDKHVEVALSEVRKLQDSTSR